MRFSVISYWIEEEGSRISTCSSELESRKTRRDDGFWVVFSGRLYGEVLMLLWQLALSYMETVYVLPGYHRLLIQCVYVCVCVMCWCKRSDLDSWPYLWYSYLGNRQYLLYSKVSCIEGWILSIYSQSRLVGARQLNN
jgi:hypothetical protein